MKKIYLETQLKICYLCFKRNISKRFKTQIKKNYLENPDKNFLSDPDKFFYLGLSTVRKVATRTPTNLLWSFPTNTYSNSFVKSLMFQMKMPKTKRLKLAIYCPQGSGTLCQHLLMMHWLCQSMTEHARVWQNMPEYACWLLVQPRGFGAFVGPNT